VKTTSRAPVIVLDGAGVGHAPATDTDLLIRAEQTKTRLEAQATQAPVSTPIAAQVKTTPSPSPAANALSGDLVVSDGKVLSRSYEGETYVGPRKALKDLENLLKDS